MKLHGISTTGFTLTALLASMALVSATNADDYEDYSQPIAPQEEQMDPEAQARSNAVDRYYSSDGIYLTPDEISQILAEQPEIVDLALSYPLALQGTNGTAHFEVNGEGQIHSQKLCDVVFGTCFWGKWAGAYVHTPDEDEVLLGYRYDGINSVSGDIYGYKAAWALTSGGEVMGELGSTSTTVSKILPVPRTNAYGVRGEANSDSAISNYGVYGKSTKANGIGVYGSNTTAGGRAGYFDGPVDQGSVYGGIVKAGLLINCSSSGAAITRSFGPKGTTATIENGESAGKCIIDLGFDVSQRYFQATGVFFLPRIVSCQFVADEDNKLKCHLYAADGNGVSGPLMLTIY